MKNKNSYLKGNAYNGKAHWGVIRDRGVGAIRTAVRIFINSVTKDANTK